MSENVVGLGAGKWGGLREGDTVDSFHHSPLSSPASLRLKSAEPAVFLTHCIDDRPLRRP